MKITLVGLGTNENSMSVAAMNAIKSGATVVCKTQLTSSAKVFEKMGVAPVYLDDIFARCRNFDTLNKKLAKAVLDKAKISPVVYCVDGSVNADNSCLIIMTKSKDYELIDGLSHCQQAITSLGIGGGYTVLSAYERQKFSAALLRPLAIYDIDNTYMLGEWKLLLSDAFGDLAPISVFTQGKRTDMCLYELDRIEQFDYSTVVVVHDQKLEEKERFSLGDLFAIVHRLRAENGCPWDRAQTRMTIRNCLIEESYELYDAIVKNDVSEITEECGDLLLQFVFHVVFGEEEHTYNRSDVISEICNKLIFRHSHVFGCDKAGDDSRALEIWEKNKAKEKGFENQTEYLESVPGSFPALMRAQKLQKRASKSKFDFTDIEQIYDKIKEETQEIRLAKQCGDEMKITEECGDLLFSVVNLIRFLGVDAEEALTISSNKFLQRFARLEKRVAEDNKNLNELTPEQIDGYYNEIK